MLGPAALNNQLRLTIKKLDLDSDSSGSEGMFSARLSGQEGKQTPPRGIALQVSGAGSSSAFPLGGQPSKQPSRSEHIVPLALRRTHRPNAGNKRKQGAMEEKGEASSHTKPKDKSKKRKSTGNSPSSSKSVKKERDRPTVDYVAPAVKKPVISTRLRVQHPEHDWYCWQCHHDQRLQSTLLRCCVCPRVYHANCARADGPIEDWVCPECEKVTNAECIETQSSAMASVTVDQLAKLLQIALGRLKALSNFDVLYKPVDSKEYPTYHLFVHHPIDLTIIEKNIQKRCYGSTEAFTADLKWILHNCTVYFGSVSKYTSSARSIVKACETEMTDLEICPDCYLSATLRRPKWFCEVCKKPHPLIWAKLTGFPFWPAKAMVEKDGLVGVRFFGQHDRAWIPAHNCFLYSKEIPFAASKKRMATLGAAIKEIELHIKNIKDIRGDFQYAAHRTPYDPNRRYTTNFVAVMPDGKVKGLTGSNWNAHSKSETVANGEKDSESQSETSNPVSSSQQESSGVSQTDASENAKAESASHEQDDVGKEEIIDVEGDEASRDSSQLSNLSVTSESSAVNKPESVQTNAESDSMCQDEGHPNRTERGVEMESPERTVNENENDRNVEITSISSVVHRSSTPLDDISEVTDDSMDVCDVDAPKSSISDEKREADGGRDILEKKLVSFPGDERKEESYEDEDEDLLMNKKHASGDHTYYMEADRSSVKEKGDAPLSILPSKLPNLDDLEASVTPPECKTPVREEPNSAQSTPHKDSFHLNLFKTIESCKASLGIQEDVDNLDVESESDVNTSEEETADSEEDENEDGVVPGGKEREPCKSEEEGEREEEEKVEDGQNVEKVEDGEDGMDLNIPASNVEEIADSEEDENEDGVVSGAQVRELCTSEEEGEREEEEKVEDGQNMEKVEDGEDRIDLNIPASIEETADSEEDENKDGVVSGAQVRELCTSEEEGEREEEEKVEDGQNVEKVEDGEDGMDLNIPASIEETADSEEDENKDGVVSGAQVGDLCTSEEEGEREEEEKVEDRQNTENVEEHEDRLDLDIPASNVESKGIGQENEENVKNEPFTMETNIHDGKSDVIAEKMTDTESSKLGDDARTGFGAENEIHEKILAEDMLKNDDGEICKNESKNSSVDITVRTTELKSSLNSESQMNADYVCNDAMQVDSITSNVVDENRTCDNQSEIGQKNEDKSAIVNLAVEEKMDVDSCDDFGDLDMLGIDSSSDGELVIDEGEKSDAEPKNQVTEKSSTSSVSAVSNVACELVTQNDVSVPVAKEQSQSTGQETLTPRSRERDDLEMPKGEGGIDDKVIPDSDVNKDNSADIKSSPGGERTVVKTESERTDQSTVSENVTTSLDDPKTMPEEDSKSKMEGVEPSLDKSKIKDDITETEEDKAKVEDDLAVEEDKEDVAARIQKIIDESVKSVSDLKEKLSSSDADLRGLVLDLQKEVITLKTKQELQKKELRHCNDLAVAEVQQMMEFSKIHKLHSIKRRFDQLRQDAVNDAKKKQWCANCGHESFYFCCWNTSYCGHQCQQKHWAVHEEECRQLEGQFSFAPPMQESLDLYRRKKKKKKKERYRDDDSDDDPTWEPEPPPTMVPRKSFIPDRIGLSSKPTMPSLSSSATTTSRLAAARDQFNKVINAVDQVKRAPLIAQQLGHTQPKQPIPATSVLKIEQGVKPTKPVLLPNQQRILVTKPDAGGRPVRLVSVNQITSGGVTTGGTSITGAGSCKLPGSNPQTVVRYVTTPAVQQGSVIAKPGVPTSVPVALQLGGNKQGVTSIVQALAQPLQSSKQGNKMIIHVNNAGGTSLLQGGAQLVNTSGAPITLNSLKQLIINAQGTPQVQTVLTAGGAQTSGPVVQSNAAGGQVVVPQVIVSNSSAQPQMQNSALQGGVKPIVVKTVTPGAANPTVSSLSPAVQTGAPVVTSIPVPVLPKVIAGNPVISPDAGTAGNTTAS